MTQDIALRSMTTLARASQPMSPRERIDLEAQLMQRVEDDRFSRPVPRFLTELPFGGSPDEITDRIAGAALVAEDPDADADESGTLAANKLVGQPVTVNDLAVMDGDKPGGWGAYLLLDVTSRTTGKRLVVNTGAKQVVVRLARAWADGKLPLEGVFAEVEGTGKQGNKALAFIAEESF